MDEKYVNKRWQFDFFPGGCFTCLTPWVVEAIDRSLIDNRSNVETRGFGETVYMSQGLRIMEKTRRIHRGQCFSTRWGSSFPLVGVKGFPKRFSFSYGLTPDRATTTVSVRVRALYYVDQCTGLPNLSTFSFKYRSMWSQDPPFNR